MIPEGYLLPLSVLGLAVATLMLTRLVQGQQEHAERRRQRTVKLEGEVTTIQQALQAVEGIPLPKALRVVLHQRVLDDLKELKGLFPRVAELGKQLDAAEQALETENNRGEATEMPELADPGKVREVLRGLELLVGELMSNRLNAYLNAAQRQALRTRLLELRAETLTRHHLGLCERLLADNKADEALSRAHGLINLLVNKGPNTESVRALHAEAEAFRANCLVAAGRPTRTTLNATPVP